MAEALQDITPLSEICEAYLGLKYDFARRKHALGTLPIRAFRLSGTRRGPLFVHNEDLRKLIDRRRKRVPAEAA